MSKRLIILREEYAGMRLDTFLPFYFINSKYPGSCKMKGDSQDRPRMLGLKTTGDKLNEEWEGLTRSAFKKLIANGKVKVNGEIAKPSLRVKSMDQIEIQWVLPQIVDLRAESFPLEILHEDRDLVVVNKPPGMVVHPAAGNSHGTLVNALLHHCSDLRGIGGEIRPGIVHRLDKDTSGAIVVAKNDFAFQHLALQFKERKVTKLYGALVWGKMIGSEGLINRPIGRHRKERKWMSSVNSLSYSKEAITEWAVENSFSFKDSRGYSMWVTFLRLRLHTGRTHQIRVHLADEGYPIVGDHVYGRKRASIFSKELSAASGLANFPRQALHAKQLGFVHPRSGFHMKIVAEWPKDMKGLLENLRDGR